MKSRGKVLIAAPVHPVLTDGLVAGGYECVMSEKITQDRAYELIGDCVGVVTSTRIMLDQALIDAAPDLAWIARMGSGMEVVDLAYAEKRGIACFSSPEGNCNAVGEHALGMLLALVRNIPASHNEILAGIWKREENRGYELEGKTVGIIGFGHTGASFAKKLRGFDVQILAYDKYQSQRIPTHITRCETLEKVYEEADIVSFHVPQQADTIKYFDQGFVDRMRRPFVLINTSRGGVVDTGALLSGLKSGKITGACLDVFEQEPLPPAGQVLRDTMSILLTMPNVVVTPHIAGYTFEAMYKMSNVLLRKINSHP